LRLSSLAMRPLVILAMASSSRRISEQAPSGIRSRRRAGFGAQSSQAFVWPTGITLHVGLASRAAGGSGLP